MTGNGCRRLICLSAAIAAMIGAPAQAGGEEPPGKLHVLTFYAATTTSKCIGTPLTPLCAAETVMACFLRRQPELCTQMDYATPPPLRKPLTERQKQRSIRYKVIGISKLTGPVIPPYYRARGVTPWRDGDMQVLIRRRHCGPTLPRPDNCAPWNTVSLSSRSPPRKNRWALASSMNLLPCL